MSKNELFVYICLASLLIHSLLLGHFFDWISAGVMWASVCALVYFVVQDIKEQDK